MSLDFKDDHSVKVLDFHWNTSADNFTHYTQTSGVMHFVCSRTYILSN